MASLRVAMCTDSYLPEINGGAKAISSHARELVARGHEVLIVAPSYTGFYDDGEDGVAVVRVPAFSFPTNPTSRLGWPSATLIARRAVMGFSPDVVHLHSPATVALGGLLAARALGVPNVQTYHTHLQSFAGLFDPRTAAGSPLLARDTPHGALVAGMRVLGRWFYNRSDLVLLPAASLERTLRADGVTAPMAVQSNGIEFHRVPAKSDFSAGSGRLVHYGRLGYEKRVDDILRAMPLVVAEVPYARLDVFGDGPARPGLETLASSLGLGDAVRFLGFRDRDELSLQLRSYDAFVTASTVETQGLALMEAMACGLPPVAVDALAIPELVKDGRTGLLVRPGDIQGLARGIVRLLTDPPLAARLGAAARAEAALHDIGPAIDGLVEHYTTLVARQGS